MASWLSVFALVLAARAEAQATRPKTEDRRPKTAAGLQVYLITVGEGAAVWEKFGHNSLWFVDSTAGIDEAYNWGTFDFKSPDFVWRFVTGDTKYWVERYPAQPLIDFFTGFDRSVELQRLNLTDAQARKALSLSRVNAIGLNKFYRYDYFRDNCSTRVRDMIDVATDGALKSATASVIVPRTYRSESVRLTDDLGLAQFGITLALGPPAETALSLWEDAFVPMRLRDMLRDVKVVVDGKTLPLVIEERVVYATKLHTERTDFPAIWLIPLIIGLFIAVDLVAVGIIGERSRGVDIAFRVQVTGWSLLTGIFGVAILCAWMFTKHVFWANNQNLLLVNPLSLWLALLTILSLRNPRWLRPAAITAAFVAMCAAIAVILLGIPGARQENLAVVALVAPAHFAAAFGLWRRSMSLRDAA